MKIKTWLLVSYFVVMILPLLAAFSLFAWVSSYDEEEQVKETILALTEVYQIQSIVENPKLYEAQADYSVIEPLANEKVIITLFDEKGKILYTTNLTRDKRQSDYRYLYQNLYEMKKGFRTYTYKQPVLLKREVIGFYEIQLARQEWVQGVSGRSYTVLAISIGFFLLLYSVILFAVNRKINRRLATLMKEMTAFANGTKLTPMPTAKDEIGQLQQHFYAMREEMEKAQQKVQTEQQMKEQMIAAISHDLKTPLTSIRAFSESLAQVQSQLPADQAQYPKVIVQKASFMQQMLDDLLMYTILQSPSYEMDLVKVEGDEFFEMLVADYDQLCKEKNIRLQEFVDVRGMYHVHPQQLVRVVDNLMSNAIQHTPKEGTIWLAALSETAPTWLLPSINSQIEWDFENWMYLIVQNEGSSIAHLKVENVFEPHFQADEARTKKESQGTGLGLSITKQIIEKHHGHINFITSKYGVCLLCQLPKLKEDAT